MNIEKLSFLKFWNKKSIKQAEPKENKIEQKTAQMSSQEALSNYGRAQVSMTPTLEERREMEEIQTREFLENFSQTNTEKLKDQLKPYRRNMSHNLTSFPFAHSKSLEKIRVFAQRDLLLEAIADYEKAQDIVNREVTTLGFIKNPTRNLMALYERATDKDLSREDKTINIDGHDYVASLNSHKSEMVVQDLTDKTMIHFARAGKFSHLDHAYGFYPTYIVTPEYSIKLGGETNLCKIESLSKVDDKDDSSSSFKRVYNLTNAHMNTPNILCKTLPDNVSSLNDRFQFFYEKPDSMFEGALNSFYDVQKSMIDNGTYTLVKPNEKVNDENVLVGEKNWKYMFSLDQV